MDDIPDAMLDAPYCPTCGQRTHLGASPEWLLAHFTGQAAAILAALIDKRRSHQSMSLTELCRVVYHDHPTMGPEYGPNVIQQLIQKIRPDLIERGWIIVGPQITKHGYQIVPTEVLRAFQE